MYLRFALACVVSGGLSSPLRAQTAPPPRPQPPAVAQIAEDEQLLPAAQLDALTAPIALYPDTLLAQVLMASTYPLEVIQADRWLAANGSLKGDALQAAAEAQPWDASVKALVATPAVLEMMSKNLDWMRLLGDAVLAQQPDLMDSVQRMRTRAYSAKTLSSGPQQTVSLREESGKQAIVIEPAQPETIHVPYYDPAVVYGSWPSPDYPPYSFPTAGYVAAGALATGLVFSAGYALGRWNNSSYWGGNVSWNNRTINIDRDRATQWQHNPQHRHGVQYRNNAVRQTYGDANLRAGRDGRMDFRGRSGEQVLQPRGEIGSGASAGARAEQRPAERPDRPDRADRLDRAPGERAGAAARPEHRPANRPGAADRPDRPGGDRARPGADAGRGSGARTASAGGGRPAPNRDSAFGNVQSGRAASLQSQRGHASMGGGIGGGGRSRPQGGAAPRGGGGGRVGAGGGGGRGGGGGGRRSDIRLKHDVVLLGHLENGLGFYRFSYAGSPGSYVGVMAQEVRQVAPYAVSRGADGYLRVDYRRIGLEFQSFAQWQARGAEVPVRQWH